jgi:prephenate dehydrogenase
MKVVGDSVSEDGLSLAGRGLIDTTRLASSPPDIWQDVTATNADEIAVALDTFIALLQDLRGELADGDRLNEVFLGAARWREKLATVTNMKV